MDATFAANTSPASIEWIRKRDGEVVRLDPDKLTLSLQHAAQELADPVTPDTLAELGRMALFFLRSNVTDAVVSSDDVAEWVEKSLRETRHVALANSYASYRQRKLWALCSLPVISDDPAAETDRSAAALWDKSRIVQVLRVRLKLDARRARAIASHVEQFVIRARFDRLSTHLIREIVNGELARWGIDQQLTPPGQINIRTAQLNSELASVDGVAQASVRLTRRVWHEFSLNEIVSRDVADAERHGLLSVDGLGAPGSLAALCIDCGTFARQPIGFRQSLVQFGRLLAVAVDSCYRLLAVDGIEAWLSFIAEPGDRPAELAEQFWSEWCARLRYCPIPCVLNLYGGMPPGADTAVGAGPLFRQEPLSAEREFAGAVSQEILDLFRRDAASWPKLRLDWHWMRAPDPVQTALVGRCVRVLEEGHPVAIAFDRVPIPLGAGLRRLREMVRPVLDYVGIRLPVLWRESGCPRSLPALEDGLRQAIQLAVRAAVQKREFIRRLPGQGERSLIDQANLAIHPIGLDWMARQLIGRGAAEDEGSLKLCETVIRFLRDAATREARHFALGVVIDHPQDPAQQNSVANDHAGDDPMQRVAGLVPVGDELGLRRRVHAAGRLHSIAQAGTLVCTRTGPGVENNQQLTETLEWISQHSELVRLQLISERPLHDQAVVAWPE